MTPRRLFALAGLVALSSAVPAAAGTLELHVTFPGGRPVTGVRLGTVGGASEWTDATGKVRLRLDLKGKDRSWIVLETIPEPGEPKSWVFLVPPDREMFVPALDRPLSVRLVLAHRADRAALLGSALGRQAALERLLFRSSRLDRTTPGERAKRRQSALAIVSRAWDLRPEEIDAAIRTVAARSSDPDEQGMAALYLEDWARAARLLAVQPVGPKAAPGEPTKIFDRPLFVAEALFRLGRVEEAFGAALTYAPTGDDPAERLNGFGLSLYETADYPLAERAFRKALAASYAPSSDFFPWTIRANLASAVKAQGRLRGVRKMQEGALAAERRYYGNDHPNTLESLSSLADTLTTEGDLAATRPLQEELLATRRRLLGPEHPDTVAVMNDLSVTLLTLGDVAGGRRLVEQVLAIRRRTLGENHPFTLRTKSNLAYLLGAEGDLDGERRLEEQLLARLQKSLGPEHSDTLDVMANLAITLRSKGHLAKALELEEKVVEVRVRRLGPHHPDTSLSQWALLNTRRRMGDELGARFLEGRLTWLLSAEEDSLLGQQRFIRGELRRLLEARQAHAAGASADEPEARRRKPG